jgi:CheY-like chemotaxis protein
MLSTALRHRLDLTGVTVLVVEDDPDSLDVLRQIVEAFGATVQTARDGADAADVVSEDDLPDLIFCDLLMPRKNGFQLMGWLQKRPHLARIPVVAVTALGTQVDFMRTFSAGFSGHLVKPIELRQVEAQLRRFFRGSGPRPS